jgi:hypothetical protein
MTSDTRGQNMGNKWNKRTLAQAWSTEHRFGPFNASINKQSFHLEEVSASFETTVLAPIRHSPFTRYAKANNRRSTVVTYS